MSRLRAHRHRSLTALLALALPATLALSACGSEQEDLKGFDAVSVSGDVGSAPKFDFKGTLSPGAAQDKVITEGTGATLADGDQVLVNYAVANGYTKKTVIDTFGDQAGGFVQKVGAKVEPQQITDLLVDPVRKEIKAGLKVGTRLAVTVSSEKLIGQYLGDQQVSSYMAGKNIGNEDGLVIVADLVAVAAKAPEGTAVTTAKPAWAPAVTLKGTTPTGLNFAGVAKPDTKLEVSTLIQGSGPEVKSGDVIAANYLGAVYNGKKPFDESYSRGEPLSAILSEEFGTVVKGWSQGLIGVKVGSRVLLKIPPALGYGDQAQGADIPANSTLYFVIDVLGAA